MEKKKIRVAFLFCIVLFAVALVVSLLFAKPSAQGGIVINEVVASNRTCPAPNGAYLDYIEVRNLSDSPVDISGYMLSDKPDAIGYTFPQGTVLAPGGYAVCWCDKNAQSPSYGSFGISNDGTDSVYLYNNANVVVDQLDVPILSANVPYIREQSGTWSRGLYLTPGFDNTYAGYEAWLKNAQVAALDVVISEIMPGADCLDADGSGRITDWVELWNRGSVAADLTGAWLTDDETDSVKWQLPTLVLQPGQQVLIRCSGEEADAGEATFRLSRDGGVVILRGKMGQLLSRVEHPSLGKDISWALCDDGSYAASHAATPGFSNDDDGYNQWLQLLHIENTSVVISEVMPANLSTLLNAAGALCDWVELWNQGSQAVDLTGFYLTNDAADRGKWQLPSLVLQPGERLTIPCSGINSTAGEATFGISRDGCTVMLSGTRGNVISRVEMPAMERDRTWALQSDGTYSATEMATPGYENTQAGRKAYLADQKAMGALVISEVMPSNSVYFRQSDAEYYDWVELTNGSDQPIDLSRYTLSNDPEQPDLFRLPQQTLQPGEFVIIICSGNTSLTGDYIHAPFTLSRQESWLYVTGPDGRFSDLLHIWDVPNGCTTGRIGQAGTFYFTQPTPAKVNGTGVVFISATPVVETEAGIYNGISSLQVTLSGQNLRYTTDGSAPDANSTPYTGAISLDRTTVVRAASFEDGKLPSDTVTAAYIINENHTLPVISLSTAPNELFGYNGLYVNYTTEREVACNISLFEEGGGFNIDCGLKMYGHMGLTMPKKSFKINFRGMYGQDMLTYPVYGEDGPTVYDSLVIRSGQDQMNTIFRDELFTSLCRDATDSVLAQRDKHVILYINGEYWGIYAIKEAFGETMYAENYQVDEHTVNMQQAPVLPDSPVFDVIKFARTNDLSDPALYAQFAEMVDIDSMIDWMIFEGYCSNTDIQQNLRYVKSSANGDKWQFCFYDLDWAWYYKNGLVGILSTQKEWQHIPMCRSAMRNAEFREKFFTRVAELKNTVLSNENVIARIDHYVQLLSPEIEREKARWGGTYADWERNVKNMKSYILDRDHWALLFEHFQRFSGMTNAEYKKYFGG